jgi:hypothetical protein
MASPAPIPISMDELISAVEDHCAYTRYYLDRETGEIVIQSEHDNSDEETGNPDLAFPYPAVDDNDRFVSIEPMEARRGYDLMDRFTASLPESVEKSALRHALAKRKPFRNFKNILYDHPAIWKKWLETNDAEIRILAEEWLRHTGIRFELVSGRSTGQ